MQQTNAKKRRLEALKQSHTSSSAVQKPVQPSSATITPPTASAAATAMAGASRQHLLQNQALTTVPYCQAGSSDGQGGPLQFPYAPLSNMPATSHVTSRLQVPAQTACKGNIEDVLDALMQPHMPLTVAHSMVAGRLPADKAVTLVNPTGRVNLAKPSSSSKGQRQLLASKLLPRAQRVQVAALPKSGIDYGAMLALHDLWCKYAGGVLANAAPESFERVLSTLDWHGALVRVVASKNPMYVHRVGVVAKATHSTFVLVSDDGRSSIVPLKGSRFECSVDCGRIVHLVLSGDNLKALKCAEKVD